jgi:hypothetical protein
VLPNAAASAPLRPGMALESGPQGCLKAARFSVTWHAHEAGIYVLALRFPGLGPQAVIAGAHADLKAPGPAQFTATLDRRKLKQLAPQAHSQADLDIVLMAPGRSERVLQQAAVPLPAELLAQSVCE